jgi:hypothetical protein
VLIFTYAEEALKQLTPSKPPQSLAIALHFGNFCQSGASQSQAYVCDFHRIRPISKRKAHRRKHRGAQRVRSLHSAAKTSFAQDQFPRNPGSDAAD